LSTLHTGDAPSAIMRLIDMGIEPFLLNAALSGVLAQRLVRKLCPECKTSRKATAEEKKLLKKFGIAGDIICEASGCVSCDDLGYKGRIGIFEFLEISPDLRSLIIANSTFDNIYKQARSDGMKTLQEDGAHKVRDGIISLAEFMRVIA